MHHPPKKTTKNFKYQGQQGTALLVGKQQPELPRFRDPKLKDNRHARSLVSKDKFMGKPDDIRFEMGQLKVSGREIGSSLNVDVFKLKAQSKNIAVAKLFLDDPVQTMLNTLSKQKKEQQSQIKASRHEEVSMMGGNSLGELDMLLREKENTGEDYCSQFPELSAKEISLASNLIGEKKPYQYRTTHKKSQRESYSIFKNKRRQTVVDGVTTKQKINFKDEFSQNKVEIKRITNLLQYRELLLTVNLTNKLFTPPEQEALYKAYVCKGNNGLLVKSIVKTRPWWSFRSSSEIESCSLVWTEWKRNKSINQLSLAFRKELIKEPSEPFQFNIKSTNKEVREKTEKKYCNFMKLIGENTQICKKFDSSSMSDSNYTFTAKINKKTFDEVCLKVVGKDVHKIEKDKDRKIVNHIPGCFYLHSKKLLFLFMTKYYQKLQKDIFSVIPTTFLITKGTSDPEFIRFQKYFQDTNAKNKQQKRGSNVWICKPGQNSNRGYGIHVVSSLGQIRSMVNQKCGSSRTLIIQKYMENPFLYNKRKFDIRMFVLITCVNGCVKGYWYEDGYARTTSKQYTLKNLDNRLIHLTNDAVQKKGQQFGKFQNCNKVTMAELQRYIEANSEVKWSTVYSRMKAISTELIEAVSRKINPQHKQYCFQLFGLDFMLDDKLAPYLIEANSNPSLEVDGNVLGKVIPRMIENVIRVAIDPIFPPPYSDTVKNKFSPGSSFQTNQLVLVYDSLRNASWESKEELEEETGADEKECEQFEGEEDPE